MEQYLGDGKSQPGGASATTPSPFDVLHIDLNGYIHVAMRSPDDSAKASQGPPEQLSETEIFSRVVDAIERAFTAAGLIVTRNTPFAGAYITQTYGRPSNRIHAVQVEIDRALYMNERTVMPNGRFKPFKDLLEGVIAEIAAIGRPMEQPLAAE